MLKYSRLTKGLKMMSWLIPDVRRRAVAFGAKFVWCVEHDRAIGECQDLAMADYGQPYFDNCQWITEEEMQQ